MVRETSSVFCKGRRRIVRCNKMPGFAVPRFIEFVTALPMTENGKVQKFRLSERGVTAATWDRTGGTRPASGGTG